MVAVVYTEQFQVTYKHTNSPTKTPVSPLPATAPSLPVPQWSKGLPYLYNQQKFKALPNKKRKENVAT